MHVVLFGKRYRLRFVWLKKGDGDCERPDRKKKQIRICTGIGEQRTLEILLHETLHAVDWWKDEEWVEEAARDIACLLWKLGYRRKGVDDDSS